MSGTREIDSLWTSLEKLSGKEASHWRPCFLFAAASPLRSQSFESPTVFLDKKIDGPWNKLGIEDMNYNVQVFLCNEYCWISRPMFDG